MSDTPSYLTPDELRRWQFGLQQANLNNIFHHCCDCDETWVASSEENCACGSRNVEHIACWQFPDD